MNPENPSPEDPERLHPLEPDLGRQLRLHQLSCAACGRAIARQATVTSGTPWNGDLVEGYCDVGRDLLKRTMEAYNAEVRRGMLLDRLRIAVQAILIGLTWGMAWNHWPILLAINILAWTFMDEWWFPLSRWLDPPRGFIR